MKNDINEKEIADKIIKEIMNNPPSDVISGTYDYQEKHTRWMLQNFGGFTKYFEEGYDFYVSLVNSINYVKKDGWGWPKQLPFIYLGNSTYPLFKAYTVLLDGFYDEAMTLSRVSYELLIKSIFCVCYPEDCYATYNNPEKGKRSFNLSNFLETDLGLDWKFLFRLSSASTHGKLYFTRIISDLKEKGKHELVGLQLSINKPMIESNVNILTFLIWAHIYLLTTLFEEIAPTDVVNKEVRKKAQNYIQALGHIVKNTPNGFTQVGKDYEKIIKIVEHAKNNENWKDLV